MKDKIIFLNPPLNPLHRYGNLSEAGAQEPPLGLTYLAAVTKNMGWQTLILDAQALGLGLKDSSDIIIKENPQVLCITLATAAVNISARLAALVKEELPDMRIIVGGCHFSSLPVQTLHDCKFFDLGVIGEGEQTLKELLKAIKENNPLGSVKGIAFRSNGRIILTATRERIKDLDSLPHPAFELLPSLKQYYRPPAQSIKALPTVSLVASRGCMGRCLFCDRGTFGNELRLHSAEYIADMLQRLQCDFGIRGILFEDDNFMLSEARLLALAKLIRKRNIKIAWSALSRIDAITEEKLKIAKSCGCWQILFGIESGSQKILDFYQKNITISQIRHAINLTKRRGLYSKGFFIIGNPLETQETLQETKDLIMDLPLDDVSLTYFTPFPGAQIWKDVDKYGQFDKEWDKLTCFNLVFTPKSLSQEYITNVSKSILGEFYSRPRIILSYLRRLHSIHVLKELYKARRSLLFYLKPDIRNEKFFINVDDFGLCEAINKGVEKLLYHKTFKRVSIMPSGYAFKSAIKIVKDNPHIEVGVHLSLLESKPVLSKEKIRSLVNREGTFEQKFSAFLIRYFFKGMNKEHISSEFRAQIDKVRNCGINITHIDTHQHIHMLPGIFRIIIKLARENNIPSVRLPLVPFDLKYFFKAGRPKRQIQQFILNILSLTYKPIAKRNNIGFCDYSYGFLESGNLSAKSLETIISSLKKGKSEIFCHPGEEDERLKTIIGHWGYNWQEELEALKSKKIKEYLVTCNADSTEGVN